MKTKKFLLDLAYDLAGSVVFALGLYTFASQSGFAPGGVSGVALMINHFTRLPIGALSLVLNLPIILLTWRTLGRDFFRRSLRSMVIFTIVIDIIFPHFPTYSGDRLMAAVFSGVACGAGLALFYMRGSSTGGMDFVICAVRRKNPHLSFGTITLVLDAAIILLGWPVYGDINAALYGLVNAFASMLIMDKIIYGADSGKLAMIVTDHGTEMARAISDAIDRGATLAPAVGSYTGQSRQILYCACANNEAYQLRRAVHSVDPDAMIMFCEASRVFGEGFSDAAADA